MAEKQVNAEQLAIIVLAKWQVINFEKDVSFMEGKKKQMSLSNYVKMC